MKVIAINEKNWHHTAYHAPFPIGQDCWSLWTLWAEARWSHKSSYNQIRQMKIHKIIFSPTGGTHRVVEILLFLLLTFFLAYIQTTEAKGQSPCFSYGASIMNEDLYCGHQEDSAFAMHSVMKFPQALYVADYLHKKGLTLSDSVLVHKNSLDAETWSPMPVSYTHLTLPTIA